MAREAKPRFGATLVRSAHDCETRLYSDNIDGLEFALMPSDLGSWHELDVWKRLGTTQDAQGAVT